MAEKAQQLKDKGNTAFKAGNFVQAIGYYTDAILAQPSEPTFFLNRAAAYLKLNKNEDAERDCSAALKLQPSNVKALYRRAQARAATNHWDNSITDFKKVLELDPSNLAAQTELQKAQSAKGSISAPRTKPSSPPKRRRVPINIIDGEESDSASKASSPRRRIPISIIDDDSSTSQGSSTSLKTANGPSSSKLQEPPKSILKNKQETPRQPRSSGGIFRTDGTSHTISTSTKSTPTPTPAPVSSERRSTHPTQQSSNWNLASLLRYFSDEKDPNLRWMAIQYTQPEKLPSFIAHSLSAEVLMQYIDTFKSLLADHCSDALKDYILEYMKSFPRVERFKTTTLFLGASDKTKIRSVWKSLGDDRVDRSLKASWGI